MTRRVASLLMILSISVSLGNVHAQQTESPEETQIKQYRIEINELTARLPPSEAQDAHAAVIGVLRRKLRDLLIEKKGGLKRDIQVFRSTARSAESLNYAAKLEAVLSTVSAEVAALDQTLTPNSRAITITVSQPAPQESPSPELSPTPEAPDVALRRSAFEVSVDNLSA